jgi:hypothetical protein
MALEAGRAAEDWQRTYPAVNSTPDTRHNSGDVTGERSNSDSQPSRRGDGDPPKPAAKIRRQIVSVLVIVMMIGSVTIWHCTQVNRLIHRLQLSSLDTHVACSNVWSNDRNCKCVTFTSVQQHTDEFGPLRVSDPYPSRYCVARINRTLNQFEVQSAGVHIKRQCMGSIVSPKDVRPSWGHVDYSPRSTFFGCTFKPVTFDRCSKWLQLSDAQIPCVSNFSYRRLQRYMPNQVSAITGEQTRNIFDTKR